MTSGDHRNVLGVSTRRIDKLVTSSGITSLSEAQLSQVSEMVRGLDDEVRQFGTRRLDGRARSWPLMRW